MVPLGSNNLATSTSHRELRRELSQAFRAVGLEGQMSSNGETAALYEHNPVLVQFH